ncbi:MAG: response regulator transcription factor [Nocardioides sp.]
MTRILIAEDDADLRLLLRLVLHRAGYRVSEARDGVEALEAMSRESFDVVLLDNMMPRMSGVEVLESVALLRRTERPLMVVISALATRADIRSYYVRGADDFLAKPFATEELVDRVRMLLDERTMTRHDARSPREGARGGTATAG